jgi:type VI secretion system protein ImpG
MREKMLEYYERELTVVRQLAQEFAEAYPKVAGRLLLEPDKCEDPHVERLIEAFAFLAARVHRKIDDGFPEITRALLGILYPHYLAPIPSMSVVEFLLDPEQGRLTSGYLIASGTQLYSRPIDGVQCRFRTCYPVTLWPIQVISARFEAADAAVLGAKAAALIRIDLRCQGGMSLRELHIDRLRFYLHGESQLVYPLYELLLNNVREVRVQSGKSKAAWKATLCPSDQPLRAVGFGKDEGMLPYPSHALLGYRLLQEYFTFPQKFLFIDLVGLDQINREGASDRLDVQILLDRAPRPDQSISADTFRLGCAPIVNLFEQRAEPIRLDHAQHEYLVIPDIRRPRANEVYAINSVTLTSPQADTVRRVQPIYSLQHAGTDERASAFWYATRKPSERKDDHGTDMYLCLVDSKFNPTAPAAETLNITTTCTNRNLPEALPVDDRLGDFELEGAAPVTRIRSLVKPTSTLRPPLSGGTQWRLISHLSLNYLSLDVAGPEALQEVLRLYDFSDSIVVRQQIAGITALSCSNVIRRPSSMGWHGFCRGLEIAVEFDEDKYIGSGVFLFASVLERVLGLYASLNSFTQLVAKSQQRERPIKQWPPRSGDQLLV